MNTPQVPADRPPALLVAARKGAWMFHADVDRRYWRVDGPHFLGHIINHLVLDPRDGRTLLAAAKTGHLGPTIFRSTDLGETWQEEETPPAFGPARNGLEARSVDHIFWLAPAHASETELDRVVDGLFYLQLANTGTLEELQFTVLPAVQHKAHMVGRG